MGPTLQIAMPRIWRVVACGPAVDAARIYPSQKLSTHTDLFPKYFCRQGREAQPLRCSPSSEESQCACDQNSLFGAVFEGLSTSRSEMSL